MDAFLAAVGWPVVDRIGIGPLKISPHGLFIAIGFLVGTIPFGKLARQRGIPPLAITSVAFWSLIGAIVGARVGYVIAHPSDFASPLEWLYVWQGGISLLGGITGATIANAVNIKRWHLRFFQVADTIAPALAFGIVIGRIGDLIIADHIGKPSSWLLAWTYKGGTMAPPFTCVNELCQAELYDGSVLTVTRGEAILRNAEGVIAQGAGVHQTALYDMILAAVLFGVLWWFIKKPRREGMATLLFGIWYGCNRLLEDSLRVDKRFGPLTGSQWTALTVVVVGIGIAIYLAVTKRSGPTTPSRLDPGPQVVTVDGGVPIRSPDGPPRDDEL
jgi:phosphatidylglycerol:prolipoprotein diacylglycerol transferase